MNVELQDELAQVTGGDTLHMTRRLPGPIDRVWAYITDGELRRQWLASGTMKQAQGAHFELVWRNDDLSASADERPEGFAPEYRATCEILEIDPPRMLRYVWPDTGEVTFELEAQGPSATLLTVTHRRLSGQALVLNVCAGWHAHIDLLEAVVGGEPPPSLWSTWKALRVRYEKALSEG